MREKVKKSIIEDDKTLENTVNKIVSACNNINRKSNKSINANVNIPIDLIYPYGNKPHLFSLPTSIWIHFYQYENNMETIDDFGLKISSEQGWTNVWGDEKYKGNFKDMFHKYFNGHILRYIDESEFVNIDELPNMSDMENYYSKEKQLLDLAQEGLSASDFKFNVLIIGNSGSGKTYFSLMVAKKLIKNNEIESVIFAPLRTMIEILNLRNNLKFTNKFLFIVDELETEITKRSITKDAQKTSWFLQLFGDNENSHDKFIGIANIPQLIDKAFFRPGRIDMIITTRNNPYTVDSIYKIFLSIIDKNKYKIDKKELIMLAETIFKSFPKNHLPISFYSTSLKLFQVYKKDTKKILIILKIFDKYKNLYNFDEIEGDDDKIGFNDCTESKVPPIIE